MRRVGPLSLLLLSSLCTAACGDPNPTPCPAVEPTTEVSLIDHANWQVVQLANDPFAAELPGEVTCGAGGHKIESGALEIDTGICNFITLRQQTIAPAERCDELRLVFWHLPLYAGKQGAKAYAAVRLGEKALLDERIDIGPDGVIEKSFTPRWTLDAPIPAGTDVTLHIHNHGLNTWKLLSLTAHR